MKNANEIKARKSRKANNEFFNMNISSLDVNDNLNSTFEHYFNDSILPEDEIVKNLENKYLFFINNSIF